MDTRTWTLTGQTLGLLGTLLVGTGLLAATQSAAAVWAARRSGLVPFLAAVVWPGIGLYIAITDRSVPFSDIIPVMATFMVAFGATVWRVRSAARRDPRRTTLGLLLQGIGAFYVAFVLSFVLAIGIYVGARWVGLVAGAT